MDTLLVNAQQPTHLTLVCTSTYPSYILVCTNIPTLHFSVQPILHFSVHQPIHPTL